jgi:hypothetical protein
MDEQWENVPTLKATVFAAREGIDKKLSELRNLLNKISTKTYDNLKQQIEKSDFSDAKTYSWRTADLGGNKLVEGLKPSKNKG